MHRPFMQSSPRTPGCSWANPAACTLRFAALSPKVFTPAACAPMRIVRANESFPPVDSVVQDSRNMASSLWASSMTGTRNEATRKWNAYGSYMPIWSAVRIRRRTDPRGAFRLRTFCSLLPITLRSAPCNRCFPPMPASEASIGSRAKKRLFVCCLFAPVMGSMDPGGFPSSLIEIGSTSLFLVRNA